MLLTPESSLLGEYFDVWISIFDAMMSVLEDVSLKILLRSITGERILQISHVVLNYDLKSISRSGKNVVFAKRHLTPDRS